MLHISAALAILSFLMKKGMFPTFLNPSVKCRRDTQPKCSGVKNAPRRLCSSLKTCVATLLSRERIIREVKTEAHEMEYIVHYLGRIIGIAWN